MDWDGGWESVPLIWKGAGATVSMFAWALVIGTAGAIALALMRLSAAKPLQWFAIGFGWLFRGIPLLILLFFGVVLIFREKSLTRFPKGLEHYVKHQLRHGKHPKRIHTALRGAGWKKNIIKAVLEKHKKTTGPRGHRSK